jgi:oxygen-independent coproporphyrinogen III oxidase
MRYSRRTLAERTLTVVDQTEVGSYFVATYPPFSVWTKGAVARDAVPALQSRPVAETPLGLYLHIPFCRKRCHFCYFRVYTDKNAQEVGDYLDVLAHEWELYSRQPAVAGRPINFVYFGGGTPSFLSTKQLQGLVARLTAVSPWDNADEITFECEPGTLTEAKLTVIREIGTTRLSLGVENFSDEILTINGRAHRSPEIFRAYEFARTLDFRNINVDLIAGMLGETDANWQSCIEQVLALAPDSVTIYQMELPHNTTISRDLKSAGGQFAQPVIDWTTKRRWVGEAFAALEAAGYTVTSAYTATKDPSRTRFVYTDRLWQGADMAGLGVASFGYMNGVHVQNLDASAPYCDAVRQERIPLARAYRPTDEERLIRELVLQLKRGTIRPSYFDAKYGVNILERFAGPFDALAAEGYLKPKAVDAVSLTRDGLLRVDWLLKRFFKPEHAGIRYT